MSTGNAAAPNGDDLGRQLSTAVVLFHQAVAARVGLTAGDLKTLELIESEGPFSASELARLTGLTGAGITNVITRLAAGGHIERETDPHDRRRAIIRATTTDNAELQDAFAHLGMALGAAIGDYSATEQTAIASYLHRMVHVLRDETARLGATRVNGAR